MNFIPNISILITTVITTYNNTTVNNNVITSNTDTDIIPNNVDRDIPEINKDLHLREGDILENKHRSAILGDDYRWESPIPYVLNEDLDMNAKGVILRAFEQFRLKSCIDFKPRESEDYYISVEKKDGCYSYVGNTFTNGQVLSIGAYCDTIAIVEHEFLHALGFFHEQSRYDRDEYVTIVWENILAGRESNFNKYNKDEITTQGTPYDYTSVMHYGKDAFTNGNGSTIITKLPVFQDVIGQRLDMSSYDALELNKLYQCNASISFLDHCSFDNGSLCEMSVCSRSDHGWERVTNVTGGPHSDHTYMGSESQAGFFMHISTVNGLEGDTAKLETRRVIPRRHCKVQCLQFFYYHSGNDSDQLNIWIREFDSEADPNGTRRLMGQITGPPANYWQLHHVPLNATKTFQVEFESHKGAGSSTGGFSVDDINLSETECPHNTWQIRNFEELWNSSSPGTDIFSPRYYSPEGYSYQAAVTFYTENAFVHVRLVSGAYDDQLQWPCSLRQITVLLLDQHPHIQQRMSRQKSITTDSQWDNPQVIGTPTGENNNTVYATEWFYTNFYVERKNLKDRAFVKGGDAFLVLDMQGKC
ncbi:meprin A subunit beta-like [Chanos chanos]|uniref:Metalloendopeptidase n=1 Tax=Chanos chanos TaxID=29144 RepID=A0A6J2WAE1_CHACN|nr:meprin A subunit beta-like [Chanos chanos]